jgi:hypothetical protein
MSWWAIFLAGSVLFTLVATIKTLLGNNGKHKHGMMTTYDLSIYIMQKLAVHSLITSFSSSYAATGMNISSELLILNKFVRNIGEGRHGSKESVLISYSVSIYHVICKFHSSTFEKFFQCHQFLFTMINKI